MPVMGYFTKAEKDNMIRDFIDFDSRLIEEKYKAVVAAYEGRFIA